MAQKWTSSIISQNRVLTFTSESNAYTGVGTCRFLGLEIVFWIYFLGKKKFFETILWEKIVLWVQFSNKPQFFGVCFNKLFWAGMILCILIYVLIMVVRTVGMINLIVANRLLTCCLDLPHLVGILLTKPLMCKIRTFMNHRF